MQPPVLRNSFSTTRTYPMGANEVRRAVETIVNRLPRWEAGSFSEGGVTAVRRTRLGFRYDVHVRLTERQIGAHTNTHAALTSVSRQSVYGFRQNKRNIREILDTVDRELRVRFPVGSP